MPTLPPVVILCGGRGTRLQEQTVDIPKPLVEIGGRPILWHVIQLYASRARGDFVLAAGYKCELIARVRRAEAEWPAGVVGRRRRHRRWTRRPAAASTASATGSARRRSGRPTPTASRTSTCARCSAFHGAHGAVATVTVVRPELQFGIAGSTATARRDRLPREAALRPLDQRRLLLLRAGRLRLPGPTPACSSASRWRAWPRTARCTRSATRASGSAWTPTRTRCSSTTCGPSGDGAVEGVGLMSASSSRPTAGRCGCAGCSTRSRSRRSTAGAGRSSSPTTPATPRRPGAAARAPAGGRTVVLRHLRSTGPGPAAKRNAAWRAAAPPLIVFTDDDCRPAADVARSAARRASSDTRARSCRARRGPTPTSWRVFQRAPHARSPGDRPAARRWRRRATSPTRAALLEAARRLRRGASRWRRGRTPTCAARARGRRAATSPRPRRSPTTPSRLGRCPQRLREPWRWQHMALLVRNATRSCASAAAAARSGSRAHALAARGAAGLALARRHRCCALPWLPWRASRARLRLGPRGLARAARELPGRARRSTASRRPRWRAARSRHRTRCCERSRSAHPVLLAGGPPRRRALRARARRRPARARPRRRGSSPAHPGRRSDTSRTACAVTRAPAPAGARGWRGGSTRTHLHAHPVHLRARCAPATTTSPTRCTPTDAAAARAGTRADRRLLATWASRTARGSTAAAAGCGSSRRPSAAADAVVALSEHARDALPALARRRGARHRAAASTSTRSRPARPRSEHADVVCAADAHASRASACRCSSRRSPTCAASTRRAAAPRRAAGRPACAIRAGVELRALDDRATLAAALPRGLGRGAADLGRGVRPRARRGARLRHAGRRRRPRGDPRGPRRTPASARLFDGEDRAPDARSRRSSSRTAPQADRRPAAHAPSTSPPQRCAERLRGALRRS